MWVIIYCLRRSFAPLDSIPVFLLLIPALLSLSAVFFSIYLWQGRIRDLPSRIQRKKCSNNNSKSEQRSTEEKIGVKTLQSLLIWPPERGSITRIRTLFTTFAATICNLCATSASESLLWNRFLKSKSLIISSLELWAGAQAADVVLMTWGAQWPSMGSAVLSQRAWRTL